jgi:catalase
MATPSPETATTLSKDFLEVFDKLSGGIHSGFRPAHAKGLLLSGAFTPAPSAASLTRAPHAQSASTPVTVRFSVGTGVPVIPDTDPNARPQGIAIRFHLGEHVHTDIIAQALDAFPVRTPEEFLEFLQAVAQSPADAPKPTPIEAFLGTHPKALAFVMTPKPVPTSFARQNYFGVTAYKFLDKAGAAKFGRFRVRPELPTEYIDDKTAAAKPPNFLFDEIKDRVAKGPIKFKVVVQLAQDGDVVDDATVHWPEDRPLAEFGTITLNALVPDDPAVQQRIIFDPIPRVDGMESSGDPLLAARSNLYLTSGRRRRKG